METHGGILIKVGQPDKAEEVCSTLLQQTSNPSEQNQYYHQLDIIQNAQGAYIESLSFY